MIKEGDIVICVDGSAGLKLNKTYRIADVYPSGFVRPNGCLSRYRPTLFKLKDTKDNG